MKLRHELELILISVARAEIIVRGGYDNHAGTSVLIRLSFCIAKLHSATRIAYCLQHLSFTKIFRKKKKIYFKKTYSFHRSMNHPLDIHL